MLHNIESADGLFDEYIIKPVDLLALQDILKNT